jgi:hypothetical protein
VRDLPSAAASLIVAARRGSRNAENFTLDLAAGQAPLYRPHDADFVLSNK